MSEGGGRSGPEGSEPVPCASCGQPARSREDYPFCSQRCRAEDLFQWLDGTYERRLFGEPEEEEAHGL